MNLSHFDLGSSSFFHLTNEQKKFIKTQLSLVPEFLSNPNSSSLTLNPVWEHYMSLLSHDDYLHESNLLGDVYM